MKKIIEYIFSMEVAGILLILIAFSIGAATFIENDYGTTVSKALVYNSLWFEIIIGLLFVNLLNNSVKIRPWKTKKWIVFMFHISFLMIILGAGITRYIGYEGLMSIREGETSNTFLSDATYMIVQNENNQIIAKKKVLFHSLDDNVISMNFDIDGKPYQLSTYNFVQNAVEYIEKTPDGKAMFELTMRSKGDFRSFSISEGEMIRLNKYTIGFNTPEKYDINLLFIDGEIKITSSYSIDYFDMTNGQEDLLMPDTNYTIQLQRLYSINDFKWVFKSFYPYAQLAVTSSDTQKGGGINAIHFSINNSDGDMIIADYAMGSSGFSSPKTIDIGGKRIRVLYGSEKIELPFSIMLRDFQLERYPATNSHSSYASEVSLIDKAANINMDYRIYMNHVLDYKGYRFFQSSYDPDEKGTVLSVNHDYWGMIVTYIGYAMMMFGMFLALFVKKTRFRYLMKKTATATVLIIGFLLFMPQQSFSQTSGDKVEKIPTEQIDQLSRLLVQGHNGRFQPFNSISSQVLRKISRKTTYKGIDSDRVLLGMMMNPGRWVNEPLIKVINDDINKIIGNDDSRVRFTDFFLSTESGNSYKLSEYVDAAYQKKPAHRGKFDKDVITVDERVNVFYSAINKDFIKIFPVPGLPNETWKTPKGPFEDYQSEDSAFVASVFKFYLQSLETGLESGDYSNANLMLNGIKQFQDRYSDITSMPADKMEQEIIYNKIGIFDRLIAPYGILGFLMLIVLFVKVLFPKYTLKWVSHSFALLILLAFIAHTLGLAARWYIAGHAPWSDGYESMIFIGWATILAGLMFYRNSPIALAATSFLTFLILFVAHLSWMNPEITNLVPVLKSYWLTIHVAIITASYGFLALGTFMGFLNLIFIIFQNKENSLRIKGKVKEISRINEMTLIIGLYLLTIGTFLGGIWANESWGRYWGWDPKETWAMVTILVYAFIVHMRFIPGIKGLFAFNLMSIIGYFSVLMTYFGVNYYLSGLHSYASSDPVPIPDFVYYFLAVLLIVSVAAYSKYKKHWEV